MKTISEIRSNDILKQIITKILLSEDNQKKKEKRDELIKYLKSFY